MELTGFCEKHQCAYVIKRTPGSWTYECPKCRAEGMYDTYATTSIKITERTTTNKIGEMHESNNSASGI